MHILATHAHNITSRPPDLLEGRMQAERLAGAAEAQHLVVTRPEGAVLNKLPKALPLPQPGAATMELFEHDGPAQTSSPGTRGGLGQRMRRLLQSASSANGRSLSLPLFRRRRRLPAAPAGGLGTACRRWPRPGAPER